MALRTLNHIRKNYSKNLLGLYTNRLLIQTAFGLVTGFQILFFYEYFGNSIEKSLIFFFILYACYTISTPIGAILLKRVGMKKMMIGAVMSLCFVFLSYALWDYNPIIAIVTYIISFSVYKALYWIPYHVEFATFMDKGHRGRQAASLYSVGDATAALLPFIGGFLLSLYGYSTLFWIGLIFIILSIYPLTIIKETHEEYSWSLGKLFREFFDKENRPLVLSSLGNGMQDTVTGVIWPIFVFMSTDSYIEFGAILAITSFIMIILRWLTGLFIDKVGSDGMLKFGNFLYFTGWIFKSLIETAYGIVVSDVYHRLGNIINKTTFDVTLYEQAADNGHYIDEYTVLKETSLLFGKTIIIIALIPMVIFWSIQTTFIVGALATLLMVLLRKRTFVR
jgi:MFS family permease